MSKLALQLQKKALKEMTERKPYFKTLVGFTYQVLPKVFKGSTDTELLCAAIDVKKGESVWDIGTGSGLVAFTAKRKGARYVLASDFNPEAVKNAKENAKLLKLKIDVRLLDVFGNIRKKFDIIAFNPPFTDHAVSRSHDIAFWDPNHEVIKKFFKGLAEYLQSRGRAFMAWSSFADTRILKRIARKYGFGLFEVKRKTGKRSLVYYAYKIEPIKK